MRFATAQGHPLDGTKFFTWGQSGPGRFMQDFLAGGVRGAGYYTELQSGVTPTQQQVFELGANSTRAFTEYFKPLRRGHQAPSAGGAGMDVASARSDGGVDGGGGGSGDGGGGGGGGGRLRRASIMSRASRCSCTTHTHAASSPRVARVIAVSRSPHDRHARCGGGGARSLSIARAVWRWR